MRLAMLRSRREPVTLDERDRARKLAFAGDLNRLIYAELPCMVSR